MVRADAVIDALEGTLSYGDRNTSFSPFYSDVGLGFDGAGIEHLYVHYNRRTNTVGGPLFALDRTVEDVTATPTAVTQEYGTGTAEYAFYDHDAWVFEADGVSGIEVDVGPDASAPVYDDDFEPFDDDEVPISRGGEGSIYRREIEDDTAIVRGYLPTLDARDPDDRVPWFLGIEATRGTLDGDDGARDTLSIRAEDGGLSVSASVGVLDVEEAAIREQLAAAPETAAEARRATREWYDDALGDGAVAWREGEEPVLARALHTLAFNATRAPGNLDDRVAAFPSRGDYPTHFLWDSCFQNLALERMGEDLALDSLRLLTENLRADGKMAHFLCSTWMRPAASQPPLVGWAGRRLADREDGDRVAEALLDPLVANTEWWLENRMTEYGLIGCWDPLETGWDDTPRLDDGPIVPCDMNAFLLLQMEAGVEFADRLGRSDLHAELAERADAYADQVVEVLYDVDDNLFRDVHLDSGRSIDLRTPACFMPLLADVPVAEERATAMIEDYLLDPDQFFGDVPFPSVAYDEPVYESDAWWRGPTWPPIAYLMLTILDSYGFEAVWREGAEAFYRTIVEDGSLSELFDSENGAGLGNDEQGWGAAIALQLNHELYAEGR